MTISALIVDDEAPARKRLRDLLANVSDVRIVAECPDGPSAVDAVFEHTPDVLFLDVQMPEMSGFEVLQQVGLDHVPAVVFVTAYDSHALDAFDARALDYLLKPFTEARFEESLERVRRVLGAGANERAEVRRQLERLLDSGLGTVKRIPVRSGDRIRFVSVSDIVRIEGAGNYVRLHTAQGDHLVRGTLKGFAEKLRSQGFVRIHHSHVVRLDRIQELEPWGHGEFMVLLDDGTKLLSSRTYSHALHEVLGRGTA